MIKTNYEIIKGIVEKRAKIKNLSIKGKYDGAFMYRYIYYKLCKDYMGKKYVHDTAAKTIKRDHNNSCYGIKTFNKLKDQKFFKRYLNIYVDCGIELLQLESQVNKLIKELTY